MCVLCVLCACVTYWTLVQNQQSAKIIQWCLKRASKINNWKVIKRKRNVKRTRNKPKKRKLMPILISKAFRSYLATVEIRSRWSNLRRITHTLSTGLFPSNISFFGIHLNPTENKNQFILSKSLCSAPSFLECIQFSIHFRRKLFAIFHFMEIDFERSVWIFSDNNIK